MERPRVVHFARLGSARAIHPRSSPASPGSPCGVLGVVMAPLASSEPDITGAGDKISATSATTTSTTSSSPSPSARTVTLLREPTRRGGSTSSSVNVDQHGHAPHVKEINTLPRYTDHRNHRHDRSASLDDNQPHHTTSSRSHISSMSYIRNDNSQEGTKSDQMNSVSRHNYTSPFRHTEPVVTNTNHEKCAKILRPSVLGPSVSASSIPTSTSRDQRQHKATKATESGIPRAAGIKYVISKQITDNSENLTRTENQSSPQQIRRVLRDSPAFAQFHSKSNRATDNHRDISKPEKQRTLPAGSNQSCKMVQMCQNSEYGLNNHSYQSHSRDDTCLTNGTVMLKPSSLPINCGRINTPVNNTQTKLSSMKTESINRSKRLQDSSHKNRPLLLNLSSGTGKAPEKVLSPASQPGCRMPQPAAHLVDSSPASSPVSPQRSESISGPPQTPTKLRPIYHHRQTNAPKSTTNLPRHGSKSQVISKNTNSKVSPSGRSKIAREEGTKQISALPTTVQSESSAPSNAHFKYAPKGQNHRQGFGFGYTCTANASIKRKSKGSSLNEMQEKPPSHGQSRNSGNSHKVNPCANNRMPSNVKNGTGRSKQPENNQNTSVDIDSFQGSWKRNSMRLATHGYSSMSDLTKSIDCLILDTDDIQIAYKDHDSHIDTKPNTEPFAPPTSSVSNEFNKESLDAKQHESTKCDGYIKKTNVGFKGQGTSVTSTAISLRSCIPNSSALSQNSKAIDEYTKKSAPQKHSSGIPVKQSYFANNSFILVPGDLNARNSDDQETSLTSYSSCSGSPSSGYSSSPASRERNQVHKPADNYYEQQDHLNKIKRRSFMLATSSISDLTCYLDDTYTPLITNGTSLASDQTSNFSSLSSENVEFHTPGSHRRQFLSLISPDCGHLNSSFGSFYSCQSQIAPSPQLPSHKTDKKDDRRESFYDNCQDSPKQIDRKDGYESEESTTESEYKTASSSSHLGKNDLNSISHDDRIRAKLLSRHWVRTTPYRHSRHAPEQSLHQYRFHVNPSQQSYHTSAYTRTNQFYSPNLPTEKFLRKKSDEIRKSPKPSKKSPSPSDTLKIPKKRVTSPIAWCTSRAAVENRRGKSPSAEQRQRSNSSPFPVVKPSTNNSVDIQNSTTAQPLRSNTKNINNYVDQYRVISTRSPDRHKDDPCFGMSDSIDGDQGDFLDEDPNERWMEPPRAPPSLGRPRRKEYAGFDSQPLPIDSFVSDSSSVYTDNTSSCSSRAPSRSADVECYSRRSSIASSTRELAACSRAYSSSASGALTPRRQMSDDTICNDFFTHGQLGESQHLGDEDFPESEEITLRRDSENSFTEAQKERPRSQSFSSLRCVSTINSKEEIVEPKSVRTQLRNSVSSQCQPHRTDPLDEVKTLARAQSCMPGYGTFDVSSRKSSTSGVSSGSCSEEYYHHSPLQQDQEHHYHHHQQQKPLKDTQLIAPTTFPSKRKYFSSRDILDLLITPEKGESAGSTSLTSLEKQAQKVCRAILCCNDMNRSMPPREFQF
ncbi:hypothetical protein PoB_002959400 [Plakobranchus ocellatus]|uniref:Uncharacterized protein n=1 Tax=Plakobranchus ocellatus TaxID=259542 RepID=A0AAV4AA36_9GAST|nr:hypothetical protein PoB_002959400 [Plakobranchus ocellatus]